MASRSKQLWWTLTACLLGLASLPGCGLSVGPKVEDRLIFIKHKGVAARVAKNVKAELVIEKDGKTFRQTLDIGGFYVISPDEVQEEK